MSQNRTESQLRILIEFLHDFQISPELLKLSQWTNGRADPPDTRTLHLLQDFRQNWSKVVTFNIYFKVRSFAFQIDNPTPQIKLSIH